MVLDKTGTSLTQVQSFIASAYSGDTWTGSGITSSTIAANNAVTGNLKLALGYIENLDPVTSNAIYTTFSGQTVNTNNILVKYGYSGDADLNGTVDSVDFGLLVQSFGQAGKFWYNGDFNYSGSVDSIDFSLLAANFAQVLNSPAASAVPSGAFDPGSVGGLVPEPSALTALGIAAGGILARRRRRS
jgi:hypothetical protein